MMGGGGACAVLVLLATNPLRVRNANASPFIHMRYDDENTKAVIDAKRKATGWFKHHNPRTG